MTTETKTTFAISWGGYSLFIITFFVLMILKLCGVCKMGWLAISAFLWGPIAFVILIAAFIGVVVAVPLLKRFFK